jgi:hypothetical protein
MAAKQKQDDSGSISSEQVVGKFKGTVTVQSQGDLADYRAKKMELVRDLWIKLNQLSRKNRGKEVEITLGKLESFEGRAKFDIILEEIGVLHLDITKHLADLYSDELLGRMLLS